MDRLPRHEVTQGGDAAASPPLRAAGSRRAGAWRAATLVVAIATLVVIGLAGDEASGATRHVAHASRPLPLLVISADQCGPKWTPPRSGRDTILVRNDSSSPVEVSLLGSDQVTVYGEIETLGPRTARTLQAVLPPGNYSFSCESDTGSDTLSDTERVSGSPVSGAHLFVPVDFSQIQLATENYRTSLMPIMKKLESDTDTLRTAVASGDLVTARSEWLTAHLDYAELGAAYDTFGRFNAEIDGRPFGLRGGVASRRWQGFLRLEYGLWHGQPTVELVPIADALDTAVHGLVTRFPLMLMPANDLALRTHEILENTLQFELTGLTDEGSHTNLATALANVRATELSLSALTPLLRAHAPRLLVSVSHGLTALATELSGFRQPDGRWMPIERLSRLQRERLDGSLSGLLEQLSRVPDLLDLPIQPGTTDG